MAQQTAIDWLIEQLWAPCRGIPSHIIEQAKEMEKEQTLKFASNSIRKVLDEDEQNPFNLEQYYFEQAKQMEKEQIEKAKEEGL